MFLSFSKPGSWACEQYEGGAYVAMRGPQSYSTPVLYSYRAVCCCCPATACGFRSSRLCRIVCLRHDDEFCFAFCVFARSFTQVATHLPPTRFGLFIMFSQCKLFCPCFASKLSLAEKVCRIKVATTVRCVVHSWWRGSLGNIFDVGAQRQNNGIPTHRTAAAAATTNKEQEQDRA